MSRYKKLEVQIYGQIVEIVDPETFEVVETGVLSDYSKLIERANELADKVEYDS